MDGAGTQHQPLYPLGYLAGLVFLFWYARAVTKGSFPVPMLFWGTTITREKQPFIYWASIAGYFIIGVGLLVYPLIHWVIS